jgi:hypothetical protein
MKKITLKTILTSVALLGVISLNAQERKTLLKESKGLNNFVYPNTETVVSPSGEVKCATTEYSQMLKNKVSSRMTPDQYDQWIAPKIAEIKARRLAAKASGIMPPPYVIPVVVHVIHNGDALGVGENITDAQVQSQIQVFNEDFGKLTGTPGDGAGVDTGISFCFAQVDPDGNPTNGITHDNLGQATWDSMADIDANLKPATIWDPTKYLNLWTCRFGGGMSTTLGYAQFPTGSGQAGMPTGGCDAAEASSDGVISAYSTFGSRTIYPAGTYSGTQYDKGRTMTHELGHMLGLRHLWGDGDCTVDDFCVDTPNCDGAYFGSGPAPTECGNLRQIENYMDYSDDIAMNIFTQDQTDRMIATLENADRRVGLLNSTVCNPIPNIQFTGSACETSATSTVEATGVCGAFNDINVTLDIDMADTADAVVTFAVNGSSTAVQGVDFDIQTPTVTFGTGDHTDKTLVLRVYNNDFVDGDRTAIIDFTVSGSGTAVANMDRNSYYVTISNDDADVLSSGVIDLFSEDFDPLTNNFTIADQDGDGNNWGISNEAAFGTTVGFTGDFLLSRSWVGGPGLNPNNYITTASPIVLPTGLANLELSFDSGTIEADPYQFEQYSVYLTASNDPATIEATTALYNETLSLAQGFTTRTINLAATATAAAGTPMYLTFRHHNTFNMNTLIIDNISISAPYVTGVQTVVNTGTPDLDALPSAGKVYATNSADSNIMADLTNNNGVDYGCVSTSVSRASGPAQMYQVAGTANYVMGKTFTVVPNSVQASGDTTLKFYFTSAEISQWVTDTGNLQSDLRIIKDNGVTQEVLATTAGTFGSHVTLEGTSTTGINGTYYFGKEQSLSVAENQFDLFGVYPNPSNGEVTISLSTSNDVNVSLFDIRGRKVYGNLHNNTSDVFNEKIDFSAIASGVYMLNVESGSKRAVKKLIIQ